MTLLVLDYVDFKETKERGDKISDYIVLHGFELKEKRRQDDAMCAHIQYSF